MLRFLDLLMLLKFIRLSKDETIQVQTSAQESVQNLIQKMWQSFHLLKISWNPYEMQYTQSIVTNMIKIPYDMQVYLGVSVTLKDYSFTRVYYNSRDYEETQIQVTNHPQIHAAHYL